MKKLYRVIKIDVLLITAQGLAYRNSLLLHKQCRFNAVHIVIRENSKQGHKLYPAFQSKQIIIIELSRRKFDIAEHI